jgi:two-component system, response regulator / RNA-binding antiterminator
MAVEPASEMTVLVYTETAEAPEIFRTGLAGVTLLLAAGPFRAATAPKANVVILERTRAGRLLLEEIASCLATNPVPIIIFVACDTEGIAREAIRIGASAFVVDGCSPSRIRSVLDVAMERFSLYRALQDELKKTQDDLQARKLVEKAKGVLMSRRNLTEEEAYRTLRTLAMKQGKSIKDIAETLLAISDLLS